MNEEKFDEQCHDIIGIAKKIGSVVHGEKAEKVLTSLTVVLIDCCKQVGFTEEVFLKLMEDSWKKYYIVPKE